MITVDELIKELKAFSDSGAGHHAVVLSSDAECNSYKLLSVADQGLFHDETGRGRGEFYDYEDVEECRKEGYISDDDELLPCVALWPQ